VARAGDCTHHSVNEYSGDFTSTIREHRSATPLDPRATFSFTLDVPGKRYPETFVLKEHGYALRVLLFVGDDANDHNLLQQGRPFIMRFRQLTVSDLS